MEVVISKDAAFTYFSGRATAVEKENIDKWVKTPVGQEMFVVYLQEWENNNLQYQANVEQGISRHFQRITNPEENPHRESELKNWEGRPRNRRWMFWMAAAGWVGLMAVGWLLRDTIQYETHATGFGETQSMELADGSRVTLNSNSSLRVPRWGFGRKTREVFLTGEASFSVIHTRDHRRFVVHANDALEVDVLGTEFNVFARARGTKVALVEGKVRLRYRDGALLKNLTMKPGDFVTRDSSGKTSLINTEHAQNYLAWQSHRYVLEKATMREVCQLFEDNFGITVRIPDSTLAMHTISGSFTALNAAEASGDTDLQCRNFARKISRWQDHNAYRVKQLP